MHSLSFRTSHGSLSSLTLLAHQTPLHGGHSRLNQCPDSLDHYTLVHIAGRRQGAN